MDDDNVIVFKPQVELARIACPECDETHWRLFSDGSIQCLECDLVLDSHVVVEIDD
ncbi:MAG: hypothetical protein AAF563_12450 [Pseudomonadota bacterium]